MASAASGRTGSSRATSPSRRPSRATASTRRPSPAQRSATPAAVLRAGQARQDHLRRALGDRCWSGASASRCSVVMRRVRASKGSSRTPGVRGAQRRDVDAGLAGRPHQRGLRVGRARGPGRPAPRSGRRRCTAPRPRAAPAWRRGRRRPAAGPRPQGVHDRSATMAPRVSVPVLSVASRVTDPRVSTAGSDRTTAPRLLIREAPPASASVTTAGRESGTAATARATAATAVISHGCPRSSPARGRPGTATTTPTEICLPEPVEPALQRGGGRLPLLHQRGHAPDSARRTRWRRRRPRRYPGRPSCPRAPCRPGPPAGRPRARSPPADRSTGRDSPVNSDSSTWRRVLRSRRASAPTTSPAVSRRMSPRTSSGWAPRRPGPARTTRAFGATRVVSARTSRIALRSWRTPSVVLTVMTSTITAQSTKSPMSAVSTAAPISTRIRCR